MSHSLASASLSTLHHLELSHLNFKLFILQEKSFRICFARKSPGTCVQSLQPNGNPWTALTVNLNVTRVSSARVILAQSDTKIRDDMAKFPFKSTKKPPTFCSCSNVRAKAQVIKVLWCAYFRRMFFCAIHSDPSFIRILTAQVLVP